MTGSLSALTVQPATSPDTIIAPAAQRPSLPHQETDIEVLSKYAASADIQDTSTLASATETSDARTIPETHTQAKQSMADGDDPLGVSNAVRKQETGRLDFAAFASQNAYNER